MNLKKEWLGLCKLIHEVQDRCDVKKAFPGYFEKSIFQSMVFMIVALFLLTMYTNNWNFQPQWLECGIDSKGPCKNPFYICQGTETLDELVVPSCSAATDLPIQVQEYLCPIGACDNPYLQRGELYGVKPNNHYFLYNDRVVLLVIFAFLLNHVVYMAKYKRLWYDRRLFE